MSAAAPAQQQLTPTIGFVHSGSPEPVAHQLAALRSGLAETGYVDGRSAAIETRWAAGQYERLPALISELVERKVALIIAASSPAARATKAATPLVPVVFTGVGRDPVQLGLVDGFNRPGGNMTGIYIVILHRLGLSGQSPTAAKRSLGVRRTAIGCRFKFLTAFWLLRRGEFPARRKLRLPWRLNDPKTGWNCSKSTKCHLAGWSDRQ